MPTSFPGGTDIYGVKTDHVSTVAAADVNNLQDAVVALEKAALHNRVVVQTTNYTAANFDAVLASAAGGAITITLPPVSAGAQVIVKKTDNSANKVTVAPQSGTIDGAVNFVIWGQYHSVTFVSDGTNWYVTETRIMDGSGNVTAGSFTASNGPYTPTAPAGGADLSGVRLGSGDPWIDVKAPTVTISGTTYTLGAKGDGVTNDTTALTNAETAVAVNGGKIFYPQGTYIINAQIPVNASNISHAGAGRYAAIIKRANATNAHMFHLTSATNAEFLDMGLDENGANNATTPHGIWLDQNSANVLVERCQFINCDGFAIYTFSSNPPVRVNNLRVIDCEFIQNSGGTHDLCTVMSNGGCVIGNNFTVGGTNSGLYIYEANECPTVGNRILGAGTGAKLLSIGSVLACPFTANTVVVGTNDIGVWIVCENDNTNNRNCVDVNFTGNTIRNSGANNNGSTAFFFNGGINANKTISNTVISHNIIDTVGLFVNYFAGTITGVYGDHNVLSGVGATLFSRTVTPTAGTERWDNNPGLNQVPANTSSTPSNPASSSGAAGVMMGLAGAITPVGSGRIWIQITGDAFHTVAGDLGFMNARYGTGTAPVNGAANTGTVAGSTINFTSALASSKVPFVLQAIVSGLVLGTAYWLDVSLGTAAASASIENVVVTAMEL